MTTSYGMQMTKHAPIWRLRYMPSHKLSKRREANTTKDPHATMAGLMRGSPSRPLVILLIGTTLLVHWQNCVQVEAFSFVPRTVRNSNPVARSWTRDSHENKGAAYDQTRRLARITQQPPQRQNHNPLFAVTLEEPPTSPVEDEPEF